MHIMIVTAAPPGSEFGSETTSIRWEHLLGELGHHVEPTYTYGKSPEHFADSSLDAMIAIGARECDNAITAYVEADESRPLIVVLNSDDLYRGMKTAPAVVKNVERADALVVFHDRATERIPQKYRDRARVIYQSVELPEGGLSAIPEPPQREENQASRYSFEVCVANHLEEHKDPLRTAKAARLLGSDSKIRVTHIGRVLDARWETQVRRESETNDRYEWYGEVPWTRALQIIRHADLMSVTPSLGGGGNIVSESIVLETPVLASAVPGNIGLLGEDYPGLFKPKDEHALADLLSAAENGKRFYNELKGACRDLEPKFEAGRERDAWDDLITTLS